MFLVDTNVVSEIRKGQRADAGAMEFLRDPGHEIFIPVHVIGELRRGVENVRRKGDIVQATHLEHWFEAIVQEFSPRTLVFDADCAEVWGRIAGAGDQNLIDKQIAAIAIVYDLTLVTRNSSDFAGIGVKLLNPFSGVSISQTQNPSTESGFPP